jgi:hypothetical protein
LTVYSETGSFKTNRSRFGDVLKSFSTHFLGIVTDYAMEAGQLPVKSCQLNRSLQHPLIGSSDDTFQKRPVCWAALD